MGIQGQLKYLLPLCPVHYIKLLSVAPWLYVFPVSRRESKDTKEIVKLISLKRTDNAMALSVRFKLMSLTISLVSFDSLRDTGNTYSHGATDNSFI